MHNLNLILKISVLFETSKVKYSTGPTVIWWFNLVHYVSKKDI